MTVVWWLGTSKLSRNVSAVSDAPDSRTVQVEWLLRGASDTAVCVWTKNCGGMGSFYRSQHELVFVFKNGKGSNRNNVQLGKYGRNRTNVWQYPGVNTLSKQSEEGNLLALHPTIKPIAQVADALLDCSARGE
jgi:hypothetical protein